MYDATHPTITPSLPAATPRSDASCDGENDRLFLVAALQAAQGREGFLSPQTLQELSLRFGLPLADITSVATFYNQFRFTAAGRYAIRVCIGTACHVKGAPQLIESFRDYLKIPDGSETDPDGLFSVEQIACLGCCMLAPAIQIDNTIYGPVTKSDIPDILRDFLASAASARPNPQARKAPAPASGEIRLCTCSSCLAVQADAVRTQIEARIAQWRLPVHLRIVGCTGASHQAPILDLITAEGRHRYGRVKPGDVDAILTAHFRGQASITIRYREAAVAILDRLVDAGGDREPPLRFPTSIRDQPDAGFWQCQTRLATATAGELDPLDLDRYRQQGGFVAYQHCLAAHDPHMRRRAIFKILNDAGLRGRGGAGFQTARKWTRVLETATQTETPSVAICNADEGDPGAFMDRMLIESFPLRVIEGLALAAWSIGAREAFIYVRHEYPIAVARVREAIRRCETAGLLQPATHDEQGHPVVGNSRAQSDNRPCIHVIEGAGAFICGEETALLASVEGRRGIPRRRPPYPADSGLHGRPTLINNVETLALVPWILRNGAPAFRAWGSTASPGTKTFALAGRVARGGLIEVPMGLTLRQIVMEAGGGITDGHTFKAVQVGGPSGGCIPAELSDTPVDYEALSAAGAMMGSGGMVVLDERDCMVDIARYFLQFTQRESCGRCTPCRVGTRRMLQILDRLSTGKALPNDLDRLEALANRVAAGSQCGLGRSAPNPVLTALRHFRTEFEAHLTGNCPARKCRALIQHVVTEACIGCTRCAQQCPVDAIPFTPHERAVIDPYLCTQCGGCRQVCPVHAIDVITPRVLPS